tara:strand:+ start:683 stop:1156 length:474 start_codon:yes stop_codon:yes gene_type:complete
MLGASTFCERPFSDQSILLAGISEQSGISSTASVALGVFSGVIDMSGIFTQTSTALYISGSTNAELSSNAVATSIGTRLRLGTTELESAFTKTSNGIMIGSGVATKSFNFVKTSNGDIKFVEVNAGATEETYTTITPSGTESWTTVNPSGTETWTEI